MIKNYLTKDKKLKISYFYTISRKIDGLSNYCKNETELGNNDEYYSFANRFIMYGK